MNQQGESIFRLSLRDFICVIYRWKNSIAATNVFLFLSILSYIAMTEYYNLMRYGLKGIV